MDCDGAGNFGAILAGLEWINDNIIMPAVLSMSIATKASISIDKAVNNLVNSTGIFAVSYLTIYCEAHNLQHSNWKLVINF